MNDCIFSADRVYRYCLTYRPDDLFSRPPRIAFIGLNPSTADEQQLDPTLRRIRSFSRLYGFGGSFIMLNLFAFRATDPRKMLAAQDPVGPDNNKIILEKTADVDTIVACWGGGGNELSRARDVMLLIGRPLVCIGRNKDGTPAHPLYMPSSDAFEPYTLPAINRS